jgi:hypothetical protein
MVDKLDRLLRRNTPHPPEGAASARFFERLAHRLMRQGVRFAQLMALIDEAEKLWPHSSSVIAFTFRVDIPCTYISANAATRSERW